MSTVDTVKLTSSRTLVRSTLWSLAGQVAPGITGIIVLPYLLRGFGTDRFGVLSLSWMVVGYFSLFDLGTGRALTKLVADLLGSGNRERLGRLIWTALGMMMILGLVAAVAAALISRWLVYTVLRIPPALQQESLSAFYLLAISLPFVITGTGLRGVLEALQRFDLVNFVRVPQGILSFIAPLLVLPFTNSLFWMVASIVVVRLLNWTAFFVICLRQVPELRHSIAFVPRESGPLFRIGGWMTVSNILAPLILYLDRFVIGSLLSVAAVAYYSTPFDVLIRITMVPGALALVMFPAFAMALTLDKDLAAHRFRQANKFVFALIFPVLFLVSSFSPELISSWMGQQFALQSAAVARVLAMGVFMNCLAQLPFSFLQAAGKSDLTAKIHLLEFIVFIVLMLTMVRWLGILGAAFAFTLRATTDAIVLLLATNHLLDGRLGRVKAMLLVLGALVPFAFAGSFVDLHARGAIAAVVLCGYVLLIPKFLFSSAERTLLWNMLAFRRSAPVE